ncbi:MAG: family 10 glycosylhydrolase [Chloroflexi bacterium]|nr:family 10 glycosylhydrolase [Ardenticatenaceae bacterium]MBL1129874.1 hypothetical protein [Chloroflexota bacterium]NOG35959.1 family 10 glycosylhydrolase [Chloroflexota bacterium]GIK55410.1 MAG: hypothetical protein BroJett015_10730 [Chloroflexota bacterium]
MKAPQTAILLLLLILGGLFTAVLAQEPPPPTYLPLVMRPLPTPTFTPTPTPTPTPTATPPSQMVEMRGLWVTRFDWTNYINPANPAKIDEIVNNAAYAGFNAIFFQVRGAADAYYDSPLEPWAYRVSAQGLGVPPNPYWDPLAYMIERAHAQNIQVHAYLNVYPVWDNCTTPPSSGITPLPLYWQLVNQHGTTSGKPNGLQWTTTGQVHCSSYWRATPASVFFDNHILSVAADLVARYDIDGIHLDHIRYGHHTTSCDPVSDGAAGVPCFSAPPAGYSSYQDWQRAQVNGTVSKFYNLLYGDNGIADKPNFWLTAAVWPVYVDYWGWGASEGYHDYYQDSKAWVGGGYIDAISPMIYGGATWDGQPYGQARWYTLVQNFQGDANGRYIVPGINADYNDFNEIVARIQMARQLGTAGHAIFSYGVLYTRGFFDDLRNGPYAQTAVPPSLPWHP